MSNDVLETLSFATALAADVLEPYCRVGQRLDPQLIRSLPHGSLTLQACVALTRVPPKRQRAVVDAITSENLELNEHHISARISALHQNLYQEKNLPELLECLLWTLHAMRETPFAPDEAAALEPAVQELAQTIKDLKSYLEDRKQQLQSELNVAEERKGEVEG